MYSDRVAGKKASRPALDTTSRLFQHITDNQEDRRLFEEASVQLYDATPDANVAKRHEVLKAKINGKIPQPWMSMTRQVNGQASSAPGLAVAPCYQSSYQLSLTRVNCLLLARRNSRKRASTPLHHSSASPEATQTSTHLLTDAKMGVAGQIASGSDQADINDHSMREAGGLQAREQGSAVSEVFGSGLRSAAAWQGGAQTACRGAHQGLNTAGGQKALVPKHKRMRAFDSDIAVECEQQQLNVVKRNRPVSENGVAVRAVRPETVAQTGTVFKRLG
ncbi:hypothetical protein WJX82_006084 [Trebouxia sp. C0006]